MRINYFSCRNFRNLEETEINNFDEMNVICGENAQGKTNLLEGMWLFTGIKSFRSAKDAAFVRFGKEKAELKMDFSADGIENFLTRLEMVAAVSRKDGKLMQDVNAKITELQKSQKRLNKKQEELNKTQKVLKSDTESLKIQQVSLNKKEA